MKEAKVKSFRRGGTPKVKSQLDKQIAAGAELRKRYKDIESTIVSINLNVQKNKAWEWVTNEGTLTKLEAARNVLIECMTPFASDFSTMKPAAVKKKWDANIATKESAALDALTPLLTVVELELANLVGMHEGRAVVSK